MNIGRIAAHKPIEGSRVANRETEIKGAKIATTADISKTINNLIINEALIYSSAFLMLPLARCSETKLTDPLDIPISASEARIIIRLVAAEKIPKSETDTARATISTNKNPQKAESVFPIKSTAVSFIVADKIELFNNSKYLFTTYFKLFYEMKKCFPIFGECIFWKIISGIIHQPQIKSK